MISVTEAASRKIKSLLVKRGGIGIRLGVKTTGCSGLAYVLEYVDKHCVDASTINYAQPDFAIYIDRKHEPYFLGTTVDYVRNGLNEGFEFRNPNERDRCGCGESFRI
jgi:iron-sulfur cluster assembly protein